MNFFYFVLIFQNCISLVLIIIVQKRLQRKYFYCLYHIVVVQIVFFTIPTFYRKVLKPTTQCLDDMKGEGRKCPRNKMYIDDIRLLFKFQNSNHLIILLFFIYKTRLYI